MAPTPSAKSNQNHSNHTKTPQTRHRLNFNLTKPLPNPHSAPAEHPVEVIGRIRDYPDRKEKPVSALQINPDRQSLRVRTEIGYRDFSLDGISVSEEEDLDSFYKKFIESRILDVKMGAKCTIMMYGPTGSGKSHTMFGCAKQPGIVYKSLKDILGNGEEEEDVESSTFVQVAVMEIYNEEIYDLLSTNNSGGGFSLGWSKGCSSKVRLEVMGKKAKNATYISGTEAGKISKEIQKVEKRRIVKSTFCNDRSSRSHCMIILDVPTVGGRLMLVDMAGSENIEQAGQVGLEAKMQTGKINQGNIALKRVVESIANGDSHVPFRDSKLTMLLQDSFEDDKSKILMILCASPDPKEMHKTITTLEYGAKAKCIVRGPVTPEKDKNEDGESNGILGSRIAAMDQFILKLQMENKLKEKERNEARKQLMKKDEEISSLKLMSEDIIKMKVSERTEILKHELEKKMEECQKTANELVEIERRKMEERMILQQQEVEVMKRRLETLELELALRGGGSSTTPPPKDETSGFAKRLLEICGSNDDPMEKSMDLSKSMDMDSVIVVPHSPVSSMWVNPEDDHEVCSSMLFTKKVSLSTVFEEEGEDVEEDDKFVDEVQKEVIEEKIMYNSPAAVLRVDSSHDDEKENEKGGLDCRKLTIQNIFTLCGNYRELPTTQQQQSITEDGVLLTSENPISEEEKENCYKKCGLDLDLDLDFVDVYVKWEASKEQNAGKFITTLKVRTNATLADLRKQIEMKLDDNKQSFTFLALGDPTGAPVGREKEGSVQAIKLPVCNEGYLACLRPAKGNHVVPFSNIDNILAAAAVAR
ncbi:kinesin-like protein KIN-10A [Impatiens glandulifera]|uniref:kinesin-like protein KIN-10A n=1 Tax=Impatiens glandulifera TaxID=253017 RepID=UPI001FB11EE1|nr:kinesin-like protein KIN-10A [Impatiens glandulifera]